MGILAFGLLLPLLLTQSRSLAAAQVSAGHVRVQLIPEKDSIQPGKAFRVAFRMEMDPGWHVYWRNPGDAGMPPEVTWDLPRGFEAGELIWPYPERIAIPPLLSFGYHGTVLLTSFITCPDTLEPGEVVDIQALLEWLACKEECIPGEAVLHLRLPVEKGRPSLSAAWSKEFARADERTPKAIPGWNVKPSIEGRKIVLALHAPGGYEGRLADVAFFPFENELIEHAAPQVLTREPFGYRLEVLRSQYHESLPEGIGGVLVSGGGWDGADAEKALRFEEPLAGSGRAGGTADAGWAAGLWKALIFAFLGGLILNLMPCVLPVLSLKILGFVKAAGESRRKALGHGLAFSAGVILSFWMLAGVLLALRAGGEQLGWGFQLQSPGFLVLLIAFMFLFGLSLLGVFEIGTSLTAAGGAQAPRNGWIGSLLNGVMATVVATPCTAPFMGSALGYSLTRPAWVAWLVFTALGLGLAAPYVLLSASPALLRFVPRPGAWMVSLRQAMGFILMATVVWLLWVLSAQAGGGGVIAVLASLLILAVGAWILGRWGGPSASSASRRFALASAALLMAGGLALGWTGVNGAGHERSPSMGWKQGELVWEPFTRERVEALRADGKPLFIDFTADWCLSCKVNERVALGSRAVQEKFNELGVTALKADWTLRDGEIAEALAAYGRSSVPLYVLYGPGKGNEPILLPEILTPGIVLKALARIENG